MSAVVIDTNVPVTANGRHPAAGIGCVANCVAALKAARGSLVLIDDGQRILDEYRRHLSHSGQPGPGDAFFKWLWNNQANRRRCRQVPITPVGGSYTDFAEYPEAPELGAFDPSDRKFVAVALASGLAPDVLEATDSKWWPLREIFQRNGVSIRFLCPELMQGEE